MRTIHPGFAVSQALNIVEISPFTLGIRWIQLVSTWSIAGTVDKVEILLATVFTIRPGLQRRERAERDPVGTVRQAGDCQGLGGVRRGHRHDGYL